MMKIPWGVAREHMLTFVGELPSGVPGKLAELCAPLKLGVLYLLVTIHHRSKKKASTCNQKEKTPAPPPPLSVVPSSAL